jgi:hypothetical protein
MTDADEKVERLILKMFRDRQGDCVGGGDVAHLRECDTALVDNVDGGDSFYGCDTGCSFVRLDAVIKCGCGQQVEWDYHEFGDLEGLFYEMDMV